MIKLRKAAERGHANFGWLDTYHSFSFGDYHDPQHMGFRVLRVINDDRIAGGGGFPTHGHRDMEIISYMVEGALEHKDSMGNTSVIRPGEVQRMSAGTGVRHSEYNHFPDKMSRLLQIWILPSDQGIQPGYEQKSFANELKSGQLTLLASGAGRNGAVSLHQDIEMYAAHGTAKTELRLELRAGRHAWVQVANGQMIVNGEKMAEGDGAAISGEPSLMIQCQTDCEFLVFDLP